MVIPNTYQVEEIAEVWLKFISIVNNHIFASISISTWIWGLRFLYEQNVSIKNWKKIIVLEKM